jgi:hypothetical protein
MRRSVFAFLGGFVVWVLVASLLNRGLRVGIPGYTAAEKTLAFTMSMKVGRLLLGAMASLAGGATIGLMTPSKTRLPWLLGAVLLAFFIPIHIQLWAKFPAWYHLVFLVTLAPLVALGAALGRRCASNRAGNLAVNAAGN